MAGYGANGGLTNDIQLNRGDELLIMDRERSDQQEKILEQATTIRNLQTHSKSIMLKVTIDILMLPLALCSIIPGEIADKSYAAEPNSSR